MGIQRQPHPRDVRYFKFITHRLKGLPDEEVADKLGFGSPAALYQRLDHDGYPVCSLCGKGPVDKPHCELPEENEGPTKPKARSGTKEHKPHPPVSNAAELFRKALAKLAREVE